MSVIRVVLHNNLILFGSPASTASRPTAVALTEDVVVSWIAQGAAGLVTGSREVVGYPGDGAGATEAGAAGCLGM